jgi:hypothetical protein
LAFAVLKKGGNAVDSAIASALCIGVIDSFATGIGGYVSEQLELEIKECWTARLTIQLQRWFYANPLTQWYI